MIQSILFFMLGFLCSGFLALMIAPALWRRAVNLTRKRIEASVPLSLSEIQADKDRMRAEFAMSTRRLEMSIKEFKDKAASQIVEISRKREELKQLSEDRDEKNRAISEMEAKASELGAELRRREEQLQRVDERLSQVQHALDERNLELEKLGRMYDDASFAASSRQIELVARETDVERLSGDLTLLRDQRKDAEKRSRETTAENKILRDSLRTETKKVADLERKLDRMVSTLSDNEEKLDRRERDLSRLREQVQSNTASDNDLNTKLLEAQQAKVNLEVELAETSLRMTQLLSGAKGGDVEKAMEKLNADRNRLEERLSTLTRENKRLRTELSAHDLSRTEDWSEERRENAILREQINDLAAEVVALTSVLEQPESPIRKLIEPDATPSQDPARDGRITSLADRVRALQKAAEIN